MAFKGVSVFSSVTLDETVVVVIRDRTDLRKPKFDFLVIQTKGVKEMDTIPSNKLVVNVFPVGGDFVRPKGIFVCY